MQVKNAFQVNPKLFVHGLCSNFKVTETLAETWYLSQTFYNHVYGWLLRKWEQLQNTPQLIYMSLNKNSVYCVMPRSSKPPDTCKWGGNELRGILKFSPEMFQLIYLLFLQFEFLSIWSSWIVHAGLHIFHQIFCFSASQTQYELVSSSSTKQSASHVTLLNQQNKPLFMYM